MKSVQKSKILPNTAIVEGKVSAKGTSDNEQVANAAQESKTSFATLIHSYYASNDSNDNNNDKTNKNNNNNFF